MVGVGLATKRMRLSCGIWTMVQGAAWVLKVGRLRLEAAVDSNHECDLPGRGQLCLCQIAL